MQFRDYLTDQIEQFGKVVAVAISKLLNIQSTGGTTAEVNEVNQALKAELDFDPESFLSKSKEELEIFIKEGSLKTEQIELLSILMDALARNQSDDKTARNYWKQALLLIELANESSSMLSMERMEFEAKLKKQISKES